MVLCYVCYNSNASFREILFTFLDYASQLKPVNWQSFVYIVSALLVTEDPATCWLSQEINCNANIVATNSKPFVLISFSSSPTPTILERISLNKFHTRNYMLPCQWLFVVPMITSCVEGTRRSPTAHDFTSSVQASLFYFRCYRCCAPAMTAKVSEPASYFQLVLCHLRGLVKPFAREAFSALEN